MTTELIPSISIAALLQSRDAVMDRVTQAMNLMREANEIAKAARLDGPMDAAHSMRYGSGFEVFEVTARKYLDASGWALLLKESGMAAHLDKTAKEAWYKAIADKKTEPMTRESIAGTFGQLIEDRGAMFERGVIECFRALSWNYKTNTPSCFGKRIIVNWGPWTREHAALDDLWRVLAVLDGQPAPDNRSATNRAYGEADKVGKIEFTTPYFHVRCYRHAQTAHVTFTRPDVVDKMNAILARHYPRALPVARGAKAA